MAGYSEFAFCYDALTENADYAARCDVLCNLLAAHGAGEGILLDLACGTGTLTAMLQKRGYDVIGVDASEEMLSLARQKLDAGAVLLCQNMETLDLYGTIDAAVCTLDSLNHITDEAAFREALRRVALFMNDGGVFLFDVNTPYKHEQVLGDNTFVYDEENDCYDRATEQFSERAYALEEIRRWLEEDRFEVLAVLDESGSRPIKNDDERALFVCKKNGTQFQ